VTTRRALLAGAALAQACSYDLDALRGTDASVDRPRVVDVRPPTDQGSPMDAPADVVVAADTGAVDAGVLAGTCDIDGAVVQLAPPVTPQRPASDAGVTLAYALMQGSLQGAPGVGLPTGNVDGGVIPGCATADSMRTPPTRIYRYHVAEGGTVTATTNTQHCTSFDTRVYAIWSCRPEDLARPAACGDDLSDGTDTNRCATCASADAGVACAPLLSTIETPAARELRRGDTVYFAVTGFNINPGVFPHRLWVGENAARIEAFPAAPTTPAVNRCVCQETTATPRTVFFPYPVPMESFPVPVSAMASTSSFLGVRDSLPAGSYSGVGMQLRVVRTTLASAAACAPAMVRAVFDLFVGGSLVTSFSIPGSLPTPRTVTVPYTAFAPTTLTRVGAGMPIELRLREVQPQPSCMTLELDAAPGANAITLYGGS
jgi:hypothetical protein